MIISTAIELVLAIALFGFILVSLGFQGEHLRDNYTITSLLTVLVLLVAALPLLAAAWNIYRSFAADSGPGIVPLAGWMLLLVVSGAGAFGLMILNESVAASMSHAAKDARIAALQQEVTSNPDAGSQACDLATADAGNAGAFSSCATYIRSLDNTRARWAELVKFTPQEAFFNASVPPGERAWFLKTYFNTRLSLSPTPSADFGDLSTMANLLGSLVQPVVWDAAALAVFYRDIAPRLNAYFGAQLAQIDELAKSLTIRDGMVVSANGEEMSPTEKAYLAAQSFRRVLAEIAAR